MSSNFAQNSDNIEKILSLKYNYISTLCYTCKRKMNVYRRYRDEPKRGKIFRKPLYYSFVECIRKFKPKNQKKAIKRRYTVKIKVFAHSNPAFGKNIYFCSKECYQDFLFKTFEADLKKLEEKNNKNTIDKSAGDKID